MCDIFYSYKFINFMYLKIIKSINMFFSYKYHIIKKLRENLYISLYRLKFI